MEKVLVRRQVFAASELGVGYLELLLSKIVFVVFVLAHLLARRRRWI